MLGYQKNKIKSICCTILFLQYFNNKLQVVTYYWFKFKLNKKLLFCPTITISNNLSLRIYCKNIVYISFLLKKKKKLYGTKLDISD